MGGQRVGSVFLGLLAVLALAAAVTADFNNRNAEVTVGLIFASVVLAVIAVFVPRIEGVLTISKDKVLIPIGRGESQAERGQVVPASVAIQGAFGGGGTLSGEVEARETPSPEPAPPPPPEPAPPPPPEPAPPPRPRVFLTQQAAETLQQLDNTRRTAVAAALEDLGRDPKFIARGSGGRAYSMRRLKEYGLRLIYRQLDKTSESEPDQYVVIAIDVDE